MKIYQKPEIKWIDLSGLNLMQNDYSALPPGGPGSFDEGQGMAPRKIV